jgi:cellulose synthase/poly-beta-1,6-N-acetylglucosamine synthase-like glycosyltransferase
MIFILALTVTLLAIYLLYPAWLLISPKVELSKPTTREPENLTILYLSKDGESTLLDKINCLLNEISYIRKSELIVIDDASDDNSVALLESINHEKLHIVSKPLSRGIPHSMNLGVRLAKYENIVFCDQRQCLEKGIIRKLVSPLKYENVGAVSSCISNFDKSEKFSLIRSHENALKYYEGLSGNLIGVYGPLYAIRKECYKEIPDHIILDDLYLTLAILRTKKVLFHSDCKIYDENLDILYDYKRTKRYLRGFIQILQDKELISQLSPRQKTMLLWHKYFRIPIPLLLFFCYLAIGLSSLGSYRFFLTFLSISLGAMLFTFLIRIRLCDQIKSLLRFVSFYSFAILDLLFSFITSFGKHLLRRT